MNSIPASQLVSSEPSVLSPGGNPLSLNMVMVDNSGDTSIPTGTVQEFADDLDVIDWYGPNSIQATLGGVYFGGFIGADSLPGALYFTPPVRVYSNSNCSNSLLIGPSFGMATSPFWMATARPIMSACFDSAVNL